MHGSVCACGEVFSDTVIERRRSVRYPYDAPIDAVCRSRRFGARGVNISVAGIAIRIQSADLVDVEIRRGDAIRLIVPLDSGEIRLRGRIAWVQAEPGAPDATIAGVTFDFKGVPYSEFIRLDRFLGRLAGFVPE